MRQTRYQPNGQMLVMLIIYIVVAMTVMTAAVSMLYVTTQSSEKITQGSNALDVAESGAETGIIKLLRDPDYTGETFSIGEGEATVTLTGTGSARTLISEGVLGNFRRKIRVEIDYTDSVLQVDSWEEI